MRQFLTPPPHARDNRCMQTETTKPKRGPGRPPEADPQRRTICYRLTTAQADALDRLARLNGTTPGKQARRLMLAVLEGGTLR